MNKKKEIPTRVQRILEIIIIGLTEQKALINSNGTKRTNQSEPRNKENLDEKSGSLRTFDE